MCGYSKLKPASTKACGITFFEPNTSHEKPPKAIFNANAGTGNNAGLCIARAKPAVNSEFVTGLGEVIFTGPDILLSNRNAMALI